MGSFLCFDIETEGTDPRTGRLLRVGWTVHPDAEPALLREEDFDPGWGGGPSYEAAQFLAFLADPEVTTIAMTKYDWRWFLLAGFEVGGPMHDLQVMAWVLDENQPLDLASLVKRYLGREMDKRIRRRGGKVWFETDDGYFVPLSKAPADQLDRYAKSDTAEEMALYQELMRRLEKHDWLDYFLARTPFTRTLVEMEVRGLPVDLDRSEKLRETVEEQAAVVDHSLHVTRNLPEAFNLGSRDQLAALLYGRRALIKDSLPITAPQRNFLRWRMGALKAEPKEQEAWNPPTGFTIGKVGTTYVHGMWQVKGLGLPVTEYTPKCANEDCDHKTPAEHKPSTSTPTLTMLGAQDPWLDDLLHWRKLNKVLTTYLRVFPERAVNGRIHARFNQTGTKTGRLSSSEPNLQNIPAHGELGHEIRDLFRGRLVVGDYSQLEPRLMAHFSQDPVLLDAYRHHKDVYLITAEGILGLRPDDVTEDQRQLAKTVFLGTQYGAQGRKLSQILTLNGFPTDIVTAKDYLTELRSLYRVLFRWKDAVMAAVKDRGYVSTLSGRHRRLKRSFKNRSNWKLVSYGERQAVNAIIQGSAGDIVEAAMVAIDAQFPQLGLLLQVHDEMAWEYPPDLDPRDVENLLPILATVAVEAHGFDLDVPLVFEPHLGDSWASAKSGDYIILPDEEENDDDEE